MKDIPCGVGGIRHVGPVIQLKEANDKALSNKKVERRILNAAGAFEFTTIQA